MENLTPEEVSKHISAMNDSVDAINQEINKDFSEEVAKRVKANIDYLSIMLKKDFIISYEESKDAFIDAINSGQEYLESNS